jgi:radical SAM superfamily enzyme
MTVLTDHFHTFGRAMQERHGMRLHKIALDAGFTCPNRDGSKGGGARGASGRKAANKHKFLASIFI